MKKNVPNEGADNDGLQNGQSPTTGDPADLPDMMLPYDNTHTAEYEYTNAMVGKGSAERGDIYTRNEWWRR